MAHRPSNRSRNLWTVDLLRIEPGDQVLEVGFGPGIAIAAAAARLGSGVVCGIDHSDRMVAMARRRNAAWERAGKVDLRLGSIADLDRFGRRFDKVLAVNVVQFWKEQVAAFETLRAVMRPGGRIALTLQPRWRGARPEDARRGGEAIAAALASAGFGDVRIEIKPLRPMPAVCVLATAPERT